eukprot:9389208-Prorocentrum_lima.AAC.1
MTSSLVGSEMCIRDSNTTISFVDRPHLSAHGLSLQELTQRGRERDWEGCLLYTSDAADDM